MDYMRVRKNFAIKKTSYAFGGKTVCAGDVVYLL